jgi:FAD:protein FMN transferase
MQPRHLTRREALATGVAAAASLAAPALARASAPTVGIGGPAYGTWWNATLRAGADAEALRVMVEETLGRIDRLMSPWRPDSAITGFNDRPSVNWQPVDAEVSTVVRAALAARQASARAFDASVGPLVGRWGFGPIASAMVPAQAEVAVGDDALRKDDPGLTLDLCGIAKGYALDRIVSALLHRGEQDFVVDLGGEIAARGQHPAGRSWQVAIEDPRQGVSGAAEIVALNGRAIATSGDKANGYTLGARRYSHIIDPATAAPVEGAAASVSVIAGNAMMADAWATALMAAGDGGPALAEANGLDALFLVREGPGLLRVPVGRFDDHLA